MRVVLKVRRKGVLILPKKLREEVSIREGDDVIVEVEGDKLVLRVLRPRVVDIDLNLVEKLLREEYELEKGKSGELLHGGEIRS